MIFSVRIPICRFILTLLFTIIATTLMAQKVYYSEIGNYTIIGIVKKKTLVENSRVSIQQEKEKLDGIVVKKEGNTYVEGRRSWEDNYIDGLFYIRNNNDKLMVNKKMGPITISNEKIKTAVIKTEDGVFEGIIEGNTLQNFVLKNGTFKYNTGEVFVGDLSKTKYGIPVGGELTLTDGSKKNDDWLTFYNFDSAEVAKILEKETLSEKLSAISTILQKRAYDQAMNLAKQAEQEKKYTLAIDKYKEALQYTKPLGYVDYYISENIKNLLLKVAQQAEREGNDSLALGKYREALIYSVIGNKEPINNNIKGLLLKIAQKAEQEGNYSIALSTYKEAQRYSNIEGECQKDLVRVQNILYAQQAEQENNYSLALEKYNEALKNSVPEIDKNIKKRINIIYAQQAEEKEDYSLALKKYKEAEQYSNSANEQKKNIERVQNILQAQQAEREENYSLALEKYNEALKDVINREDDYINKKISHITILKEKKEIEEQEKAEKLKREAREKETKLAKEAKEKERRQELTKKYGAKWVDYILKKELAIGMPRDAVFEFLPKQVYIPNKRVVGNHVTETYRIDMNLAQLWVFSEIKKESGDAGLRLLYEQLMVIQMFGGNSDSQFYSAIRQILPTLEFKDGKLSSYSSY